MTPNAVYERTREGLTGLLPGRAARRILDDALQSKERTADAVSGSEMAQLLLGPVYHGLVGVLPRDALRREIKLLARTVAAIEAPERAQQLPAEAVVAVASPDEHPSAPVPEPRTRPTPEVAAVEQDPESALARTLPADPDRVLLALAVLDAVEGIAVFDEAGRTVRIRGDVHDSEALGRVIAAGGALLARHGALRTVCVTTTHGVLVTVPVPPQWLAVTGATNLNIGAVYAALAALEEER
ncbi:MAG: hypothetical protein H0U69_17025 [Trueperaceae bacterium]|nr:hypothetical protein [Trueperaceae bacterium]